MEIQEGLAGDAKQHDKRIYWIERLEVAKDAALDARYVPIQGEKEAAKLISSRQFNQKFRYVGWSDGQTYDKTIRDAKLGKLSAADLAKHLETGELDDARTGALRAAFAAELDVAKRNRDKNRPRLFKVTNINGDPVTRGSVVEAVELMGQSA